VVPDLGRVVEDGDLLGVARGGGHDLGERLVGEVGARDQLVQVVHVALVVLAVVEADGVGGDHRVQRVVGIGQLHQAERPRRRGGLRPGHARQTTETRGHGQTGRTEQEMTAADETRRLITVDGAHGLLLLSLG